jgi:rRNA maturation endonuclease Nob1
MSNISDSFDAKATCWTGTHNQQPILQTLTVILMTTWDFINKRSQWHLHCTDCTLKLFSTDFFHHTYLHQFLTRDIMILTQPYLLQ